MHAALAFGLCALVAQLDPTDRATVTAASARASKVTSYVVETSSACVTLSIPDEWTPLVTNTGPTILTVHRMCGCIALKIADRMAYLPCDEHAASVRLVLPKDAPVK